VTGRQTAGMFINLNTSSINTDLKIEDSWLSEAEAKLIFERINYFLGRGNWISCADAPKFAEINRYTTGKIGKFPFVCGDNWFGVNSESPDYLKTNSNFK